MMSTTTTTTTTTVQQCLEEELLQAKEEETEDVREAELVTFENCSKGIGIKICGGCSQDGRELNGIFVKRILPSGLADIEGSLQYGDQILEVNGDSFEGVTNERAVSILRLAAASNFVEMVIARDDIARKEFREILEKQNGISTACTPVPGEFQRSKSNSRATSPSGYGSDSHLKSAGQRLNSTETESPVHSLPPSYSEEFPQTQQKQMNDEHVVPNGDSMMMKSEVQASHFHPSVRHMMPSMSSTPQVKDFTSRIDNRQHLSVNSMLISPVYPETESSLAPGIRSIVSDKSFNSDSANCLRKTGSLSRSRKLSLDPTVRLKIEKLEVALRYLGLEPSAHQESEMRQRLRVDVSGTVNYGDFVAVVREVFHDELKEKKIDPRAMLFAANDLKDMMDPPAFKTRMNDISDLGDDYQSLRHERDELRHEYKTLLQRLHELESSRKRTEEDLRDTKKRAQDETWSLRKKVQIAERAQKEARNMEKDYEEVVQLLENELVKSRLQDNKLQQKIAILSCELKKAETEKKTYEVATEKLLQFAENVHETIMGYENGSSIRPTGEQARDNIPPAYLSKHKTPTPKSLATEAKTVVSSVRALVEQDPLPHGWEECYTVDGMKYFTNHVTQTTTWFHPKSGVQQSSIVQGMKKTKH